MYWEMYWNVLEFHNIHSVATLCKSNLQFFSYMLCVTLFFRVRQVGLIVCLHFYLYCYSNTKGTYSSVRYHPIYDILVKKWCKNFCIFPISSVFFSLYFLYFDNFFCISLEPHQEACLYSGGPVMKLRVHEGSKVTGARFFVKTLKNGLKIDFFNFFSKLSH